MFGIANDLIPSEESKMDCVHLEHEKVTKLFLVTLRGGVEEGGDSRTRKRIQ